MIKTFKTSHLPPATCSGSLVCSNPIHFSEVISRTWAVTYSDPATASKPPESLLKDPSGLKINAPINTAILEIIIANTVIFVLVVFINF